MNFGCQRSYGFWSKFKFFEQVPFDGYILVITNPNFNKPAWKVHLVILMHLTDSSAKLPMLNEVKVYETGLSFWSRFPLIDHSSVIIGSIFPKFEKMMMLSQSNRFQMLKEAEHRFCLTAPPFFWTFKVIKLNSSSYHNA